MFISLIFNDGLWLAFLLPAVLAFGFGGTFYYFYRPTEELRNREAFLVVGSTWLVLSLVGAFPFWLSASVASYTDAVFETMSALTTTGATIYGGTTAEGINNPAVSSLAPSLLFWRSLGHWLGGMGIIVLSLAIFPFLGIGGNQLFRAETTGPTSDKLTPRVQETAKLLWGVYFIITAAEFLFLWIHPSMDWFQALNHAFATMATGGFSTFDGSIGELDSAYIDFVITFFMLLAGVNFALHFKFLSGKFSKVFEDRELRFYLFIIFLSTLFLTGVLWLKGNYSLFDSFRYGSFQALSILTSTGFGTSDYEIWPVFGQFVIFILFISGACAGSTTGGFKMIRWLIVVRQLRKQIKTIIHPQAIIPVRIGKNVVDEKTLHTVISFFTIYVLIVGLGGFIFSLFDLDLLTSLSASLSAVGNIGPGFGSIGPTENWAHFPLLAKWVSIFLMMIGRLEIFTVLVIFSPAFWKQ